MVYLIDKKNSNVDELLKDNTVIKYETVYVCEDVEEEQIIEEPKNGLIEDSYYENNEMKKGVINIDSNSYYFEENSL